MFVEVVRLAITTTPFRSGLANTLELRAKNEHGTPKTRRSSLYVLKTN